MMIDCADLHWPRIRYRRSRHRYTRRMPSEYMDADSLPEVYNRTPESAQVLHAQAAELLELAQELERLTKGTPAWYAGTRARVGARATLEQAEERGRPW